MVSRALRLAVLAGVVAAGGAWADGNSNSNSNAGDDPFELSCVEWADAGVSEAGLSSSDGGAELRCIKYQTPYGCSSAGGPLGLGLFAFAFRAWRARPRGRAPSTALRRR